jgi:hypothetical protein
VKNAPASRHEIVRYWGAAILVTGLLAAALIYAVADDDKDREIATEIASGRMYQHNLELMGGKLGAVMADVNDWFASLWHGKRLAYTVAALAVATGAVCFWVAHLMSDRIEPPHEH